MHCKTKKTLNQNNENFFGQCSGYERLGPGFGGTEGIAGFMRNVPWRSLDNSSPNKG